MHNHLYNLPDPCDICDKHVASEPIELSVGTEPADVLFACVKCAQLLLGASIPMSQERNYIGSEMK